MTQREQIIQVVNKLFIYTDRRDWQGLQEEVFTSEVWFDVTSLGAAQPEVLTAPAICDMWAAGFEGIDHIHHQAGTYVVEIDGEQASVDAYAIATHYKKMAKEGHTRTFVGSYKLGLTHLESGWRLNSFAYYLKYIDGNQQLI